MKNEMEKCEENKMTSYKKFVQVMLMTFLVVSLSPAVDASPSTWLLSEVRFNDGGLASGWFDYDPRTGNLLRWEITVQGGNSVTYPVFTYDKTNSTFGRFNLGNPQETLIVTSFLGDSRFGDRQRTLRMTPTAMLTDDGGHIDLDLVTDGNGSGGVECYQCAPSRLITSGFLTSLGVTGQTRLFLNQGRFKVEVDWQTASGNEGAGKVVPFEAPFDQDESGFFYFFNIRNWEMLVKVLDGCDINGHFWVFAAAATDVGYTLRVTDTENDVLREYENPAGRDAPALTDDEAFATCPSFNQP